MNDTTAGDDGDAPSQTVIEHTPVGPPGFELQEEVGRGGMGVVFRARDLALDREVAVKLLQEQFAPDSATAARFVEEARITGQLQHPGIPAVYQVGTLANARPFLAMKLIKGDTLDTLVKQNAPYDPLSVFEVIAQAVGYAHAHGVIHRDLKPANVMVGGFGEVQVMDWGLAKVLGPSPPTAVGGLGVADPEAMSGADPEVTTDLLVSQLERDTDGDQTQAGTVLGTPAYMASEQATGEIARVGARSDVFGLGAVLCVLLTGKPPYAGRDAASVRLAAVRGQTEEAFARLDACGADPDVVALCKRCAAETEAKTNETRARDAETEAKTNETIANTERDAKGIALAAETAERQRAEKAEGEAKQERDRKDVALKAEQKARQQAFTALRTMTADVVERKFAQGTVLTDDDRKFLRGVIAQFDAFAAIQGNDADSRWVRAEGRSRVGFMRYTLGELKDAETDYRQALAIQKQLAADFPTRPEFRSNLARSHNDLGNLLRGTGRLKDAEAEYTTALAIFKQLAADFPTRPDYRNDVAGTCVNLALLHRKQGDLAAAKQLLLEGRPHHLAALKASPRNPTYRQFYRNHLYVLTSVHAGLLEKDEAVRTAETRRDVGWDAAADAVDAASFLSVCIAIVSRHEKLNLLQRAEAVKFYTDATLKFLREAIARGYKDAARLKANPAFAPLRNNDDFKKLLAELEKAATPAPPSREP